MTQLLLATKLYFPPARPDLVPRPRLIEQLNAGFHKPLTLISAPAGYGKTTLLSGWRSRTGSDYPLAWLSLDPEDNNLDRFLTYISAALETLDSSLTQDLVSRLHLPHLPPLEELITALINGVSRFPQEFALVLDDYHVITEPVIHSALAYFLDHLPPNMHLVLLTRSDPPLHLAKLRAQGDMIELRAGDLRFTNEESARFLNDVMGLNLSEENISALDQRTEGWIVGLQMAAISMRGKADVSAFIRAFSGSHRYILDYFVEEVLQQQSESVQTFLLQTSILDRLTGSLCDAVLGGSNDGAQILLDLERKNLFLIPLDEERRWYRYHHLFSDLLSQRLRGTHPEIVNDLFGRAATWFEQNRYLEDAVGYALKAQDFALATRLIDQIKNNLWSRGELRMLLVWFKTLPEALVRSQPELSLNYAACLTLAGYFDASEQWLQQAEAGFAPMIPADRNAALRVLMVPLYRSVHARYHGDYQTAVDLCLGVLDKSPVSFELRYRGVGLLFLGQAHFHSGNTIAAGRVLPDAMQANLASGHVEAYLNACHHLAQLRVLQGRLHEARAIYEQASQVTIEQGFLTFSGTEHACLGDLYREWNRLEEAAVEIQKGIDLAEAGDHIMFLTDVYLARVRLALSQKDWEIGLSYLQKAGGVACRCPTSVEIDLLQTWHARLELARGNLAEAGIWAGRFEAEMKGKEILDPFVPQTEFALLTLARIWLAQGKTGQASDLLERVRHGAQEAGRNGRALEAQLLQALADLAAGNEGQAIEKFIQVLARAEPQGYVRLVIEEGTPVAKLLYQLAAQRAAPVHEYAERLLAAYLQEAAKQPFLNTKALPGKILVEPLSKREIEVLHLMSEGCSNKDIASRLVISIGTVKRHTVNIFRKLDAANRTQAVAIARELEII
jgi:LuxR family transcriptional regulator, maltose regulon positive regulatory protein